MFRDWKWKISTGGWHDYVTIFDNRPYAAMHIETDVFSQNGEVKEKYFLYFIPPYLKGYDKNDGTKILGKFFDLEKAKLYAEKHVGKLLEEWKRDTREKLNDPDVCFDDISDMDWIILIDDLTTEEKNEKG